MHALVIGDSARISGVIRDLLVKERYVCEAQDRLGLGSSASMVSRDADLVVVHLAADPTRALVFLSELRRVTKGRIIAVEPSGDAKLILRSLRDGAEHYLDEAEVAQELAGTLAGLKALRSLIPRKPGRVVRDQAQRRLGSEHPGRHPGRAARPGTPELRAAGLRSGHGRPHRPAGPETQGCPRGPPEVLDPDGSRGLRALPDPPCHRREPARLLAVRTTTWRTSRPRASQKSSTGPGDCTPK